jgi:hypothetical protein
MTTNGWVRRVAATGLAAVLVAGVGACSYERERERVREADRDPDSLRLDPELVSSLTTFDACDDLLAYLRTEGAKLVGPYGFGGGPMTYATGGATGATAARAGAVQEDAAGSASAPVTTAAPKAVADAPSAAPDGFSTTNVQEEGVDEPDLVETDGRRLVTVTGDRLRVVDVTEDQPRLLGTLRLDGDPDRNGGGYGGAQLLLAGDRVAILRPQYGGIAELSGRAVAGRSIAPIAQPVSSTKVTVVDLGDPTAPKVADEVTFDGNLVAARMVDGVVRVVLRSGFPNLPFLFPSGSEQSVEVATEANRKVVADSTLDDWLPHHSVDGGAARRTTDCDAVRHPGAFSGLGMVTVVSVDLEDARPGPGATILGAGETVYASASNLYVTSSRWTAGPVPSCPPNASCAASFVPATNETDVHQFSIEDRVRTTYEASGRIAGHLLSSYSLSEQDGVLRVATTDDTKQESAVVVLRRDGDELRQIGAVEGLGKGERIYAVRFLGDRAYVVTFRQTDPLHVIDLRDPEHPALAGELQIPGYSAYLHPLDDHRLLGVGQDASDRGRVQGTQLSLFDVSDPAHPTRLAVATLPATVSEVEADPHAFLWWAPQQLAVVPVQSFATGTSAGFGFVIGDTGIEERGHLQQPDGSQVRRTMVVGGRLLTLSDAGVATSDLTTFAHEGWLAY